MAGGVLDERSQLRHDPPGCDSGGSGSSYDGCEIIHIENGNRKFWY